MTKYSNKKVTIHQIVDTFYNEYERSILKEYPSFIDRLLELGLINEIKEETIYLARHENEYRVDSLEQEYGSASVYLNANNK